MHNFRLTCSALMVSFLAVYPAAITHASDLQEWIKSFEDTVYHVKSEAYQADFSRKQEEFDQKERQLKRAAGYLDLNLDSVPGFQQQQKKRTALQLEEEYLEMLSEANDDVRAARLGLDPDPHFIPEDENKPFASFARVARMIQKIPSSKQIFRADIMNEIAEKGLDIISYCTDMRLPHSRLSTNQAFEENPELSFRINYVATLYAQLFNFEIPDPRNVNYEKLWIRVEKKVDAYLQPTHEIDK